MCDWGGGPDGYYSHGYPDRDRDEEPRMTLADRVRRLLSDGKMRTCMQILHELGDPCKSDSLSSTLLKMGRKGELEMRENFGPRGGRGYKKTC